MADAQVYASNGNPALDALNQGLNIFAGFGQQAANIYSTFKNADAAAAVTKAQQQAAQSPAPNYNVPIAQYTGSTAGISVANAAVLLGGAFILIAGGVWLWNKVS